MADSQVSGLVEQVKVGNTTHNLASTAYGICDTAAETAAKTVNMTGFYLTKGITVHIKFTNANSAASPTLNINGTGAIPILFSQNTVDINGYYGWNTNDLLSFTYDGTNWIMTNSSYALSAGSVLSGNIKPMDTKTYNLELYNSNTGANYYQTFMSVIPTDYNAIWIVKYRITVTASGHSDYTEISDVSISGRANTYYSYKIYNSLVNYPIYYHVLLNSSSTSTPHELGVRIAGSYGATDVNKVAKVELIEYINCTATLLNTLKLYTSTTPSGYAAWRTFNATSNGLWETGDSNDTALYIYSNGFKTQLPTSDSAVKHKVYRYTLFAKTSNGSYQSFVNEGNTTATTKTKNTVGFLPEGKVYYNSNGSDYTTAILNISPYEQYHVVDYRYTFNITNASLIDYGETYIKYTYNTTDKLLYLADDWLVISVTSDKASTTFETGYIYQRIGSKYYTGTSNWYQGSLLLDNPYYTYDGTKLQIWQPHAAVADNILLSGITGADDLKAIEAISGNSGLLKKTAANTWSLDTNSYVTSSGVTSITIKTSSPLTGGSNTATTDTGTYTLGIDTSGTWSGTATKATKDADGNTISSTYLKLDGSNNMTADVNIITGDTDKFVNFWYNTNKKAGASWRLGMLGSGSADTNYFVIQSGTSTTSATTWNNVLRIGQNTYDVNIPSTTASTTTATGALTVGGGLGVAGQVTATTLKGGTITIGGSSDVASKTISSSSTLYLNRASNASIIFSHAGTYKMRIDTSNAFRPETTNTLSIGTSDYKWADVYATNLHGTLATTDLSGTIANNQLANSSITLGGTTINLGGTCTSIYGPFRIVTSRDSTKAFSIRGNNDSEITKLWMNDTTFNIQVNNDDSLVYAKIELNATDTINNNNGASASISSVQFKGQNNKSTVIADYFSGNGSSLTNLNASNLSSGTVPVARLPLATAEAAGVVKIGSGISVNDGTISVSAANLGLSSALRYQGTTTTVMSDGLTTAAVTIDGNSHTPTQGDVVIYNDAEYLWTGSLWELIGAESSFKKVQTAVSTSTASGSSATTFVSSVTQDTQGVITVKTSTLNTSGTWSGTASKATTTADTSSTLYIVGVASGATSTLKHDTSVTVKGGAVSATTYNALTLTAATTGFTIAGGSTTSKTLTVNESVTLKAGSSTYLAYYNGNNVLQSHSLAHFSDEFGSSVKDKKNELVLGNGTGKASNGSSWGQLALYSSGTKGTYLKTEENSTAWYTATLPAKSGTIAYTSDVVASQIEIIRFTA